MPPSGKEKHPTYATSSCMSIFLVFASCQEKKYKLQAFDKDLMSTTLSLNLAAHISQSLEG